MKMHPVFIETACFLGIEGNDGRIFPKATAFYVVVPFEKNRQIGRGYLVTARHNIELAKSQQLYASVNQGAMGSDRVAKWLPITTDVWFTGDSDSIDIAIADWRPDSTDYHSYKGILTDNFIEGPPDGSPPFELMPGLETATIGLFSYHPGQDRHTPIVRSGNLAAIPSDPISSGLGPASGYLIESRSVGGLSGSPVFVGEDIYTGMKRTPLLGLIHGHYDWREEARGNHANTIHTGIAIVTPSQEILSVLKSSDCVSTRKNFPCIF